MVAILGKDQIFYSVLTSVSESEKFNCFNKFFVFKVIFEVIAFKMFSK